MAPNINKVRYVIQVDPNLWHHDQSNEINDYLAIDGWILLNTATEASTGDSGPHSWIYYSVGWIGEGEPKIPPARPLSQ